MTHISYIKSSLNHSSALTTPPVALSQFGLWKSIKKAFKKWAKPLAAIVGIVLSIAVPFIAPMVAGVIFAGTSLATGVIGAAIAGAGMGAAAGALTAYGTGQNVLMGAALGGLGGAIGGGVAGYAQTGTLMGGAAAGTAAPGTAAAAAPGAAGAAGAPGAGLSAGVAGAAPGAAGVATGATTGLGKSLLEASLKAAPAAIGTLVSSLAPSDVPQATEELQAEMQRLQNSDIDAYNKAKVLYDQLYARYQQIDPVAAAQLAEGNVQMKIAGQVSDIGRNVARGAASADYAVDAETRRTVVAGAAEGTNAYTDAYYKADADKTYSLAQLRPPQYNSSSAQYLENQLRRAEGQTAGLATDVSTALTPFSLALAPKDTTVISDDEKRRRAGLQDKNFVTI